MISVQQLNLFDEEEFNTLSTNLSLMCSDICVLYTQSLDSSHHGRPSVREVVHTGRRGRPQIVFDPAFLAWAYNQRSISALARFLRVGRTTLRNALVENGLITTTASNPNPDNSSLDLQHQVLPDILNTIHSDTVDSGLPVSEDDLLEPTLQNPSTLPSDIAELATSTNTSNPTSHSIHHSHVSDDELDDLIIRLRFHYRRAGIRMLDGMLRRLGHRVQIEQIRQSLLRIDPVRRVFERIRIRRRTYSVAGPNTLWHHDGQHGKLLKFGKNYPS